MSTTEKDRTRYFELDPVTDYSSYVGDLIIDTRSMKTAMNRRAREADKLGALGVKNAYRRAVSRLNHAFIDGAHALSMAQWDEIATLTGVAEAPELWKAYLAEARQEAA